MGAAGSGGQHIPWPMLLPTDPIGLEWQTAASGSCDQLNLQMLQTTPFDHYSLRIQQPSAPVPNSTIKKLHDLQPSPIPDGSACSLLSVCNAQVLDCSGIILEYVYISNVQYLLGSRSSSGKNADTNTDQITVLMLVTVAGTQCREAEQQLELVRYPVCYTQ
ncbi:hypothetical protein UY3_13150 [Chelonia mydas]|uniref:Uncharacterized protein n=1 Tax=Chelonia mydas TaxID=8469 RepID=M7B2T3_CHEMY|nr:hypothetical protein UY3_13150 [Chelonia mydas]